VPGLVAGFAVARLVLGLGESGNFPACIKTVGEWLPLVVIYNMSAVGSIYVRSLPGNFLSLDWSPNRARKSAILI
jgi:MFS family permease